MKTIDLETHRNVRNIRNSAKQLRHIISEINCDSGRYAEHAELEQDLNTWMEELKRKTLSAFELEVVDDVRQWIDDATEGSPNRIDCTFLLTKVAEHLEQSAKKLRLHSRLRQTHVDCVSVFIGA